MPGCSAGAVGPKGPRDSDAAGTAGGSRDATVPGRQGNPRIGNRCLATPPHCSGHRCFLGWRKTRSEGEAGTHLAAADAHAAVVEPELAQGEAGRALEQGLEASNTVWPECIVTEVQLHQLRARRDEALPEGDLGKEEACQSIPQTRGHPGEQKSVSKHPGERLLISLNNCMKNHFSQ